VSSSGFHSNSIGAVGFHTANGWHGGWGNGWHGGWGGGWHGGCWNCGFGWGWGWGFGWGWGGFGWGWPGFYGYNPYWYNPYWGVGYPYYGYPGYSITYGDPNDSSSNQAPVQSSNGDYSFSANNNLGVAAPGTVTNDNNSIATNDNNNVEPPLESDNTNPITGNVAASAPTALIYLKDGTTYAASDYWLQGGQLHYTVNYGGESTLSMDEVDLQRTVDENARRGIRFSLKPNPSRVSSQPRQPNQNNSAPVTTPAPSTDPQLQTSSQSQT
jgi:hypothetical protein